MVAAAVLTAHKKVGRVRCTASPTALATWTHHISDAGDDKRYSNRHASAVRPIHLANTIIHRRTAGHRPVPSGTE